MNQDLYDTGLATRRKVLGDAYVDASLAAVTDFSRDIQDYVTQYCWGDVWNRPGLSLQERSLINLAMITALNRPDRKSTRLNSSHFQVSRMPSSA